MEHYVYLKCGHINYRNPDILKHGWNKTALCRKLSHIRMNRINFCVQRRIGITIIFNLLKGHLKLYDCILGCNSNFNTDLS
jgi:hypothetical protein